MEAERGPKMGEDGNHLPQMERYGRRNAAVFEAFLRPLVHTRVIQAHKRDSLSDGGDLDGLG